MLVELSLKLRAGHPVASARGHRAVLMPDSGEARAVPVAVCVQVDQLAPCAGVVVELLLVLSWRHEVLSPEAPDGFVFVERGIGLDVVA